MTMKRSKKKEKLKQAALRLNERRSERERIYRVTIYHSTIRLIIILMLLCVNNSFEPHPPLLRYTQSTFLVFVTALNVMFIDFCSALSAE